MYSIKKIEAGCHLMFSETIDAAEMTRWLEESRSFLSALSAPYGVFVDMRALKPLTPESQAVMQAGQKLYKEKGMIRSVVILASAVVTMQFKRIARETGIYEWERYIDATTVSNWEEIGIAWIRDAVDPDL